MVRRGTLAGGKGDGAPSFKVKQLTFAFHDAVVADGRTRLVMDGAFAKGPRLLRTGKMGLEFREAIYGQPEEWRGFIRRAYRLALASASAELIRLSETGAVNKQDAALN
jgi:hypothetical protein